jgi:threonine/homoserine/homoserine lactone efflux protein
MAAQSSSVLITRACVVGSTVSHAAEAWHAAWGCVGATVACIGWHWDCRLVGLGRDSSQAPATRLSRCFDGGDTGVFTCVGCGLCSCGLMVLLHPPNESVQNRASPTLE